MSFNNVVPGWLIREMLETPGGEERFLKTMGYKEETDDEVRPDVPEDPHFVEEGQ